jgi:hypothetical protein
MKKNSLVNNAKKKAGTSKKESSKEDYKKMKKY